MEHGTAACIVCNQAFTKRKPQQVACSVVCRNRIPRETGGIRTKAGLDPRTCPICGLEYQPVRENQRACSRRCRDTLPDKIAAQTVEAIVQHFAGETPKKEILIPTALYRKADAEKDASL